jgi:hypothetical protein
MESDMRTGFAIIPGLFALLSALPPRRFTHRRSSG